MMTIDELIEQADQLAKYHGPDAWKELVRAWAAEKDRSAAWKAPPEKKITFEFPHLRMVKVKIALAVDSKGSWGASGWSSQDPNYDPWSGVSDMLEPGEHRWWLEAEVPIPDVPTVVAEPTPAGDPT